MVLELIDAGAHPPSPRCWAATPPPSGNFKNTYFVVMTVSNILRLYDLSFIRN